MLKMTPQVSLIPELETALTRGAPRRRETLERITDLFINDAGRLSEEHVALFDDVIGRLIVEIEAKALADLAGRLAPVGNAPVSVVRTLARHHDIAVAGPLLRQSSRLAEQDLVDIARTRERRHLVAISSRAEIGEAVTDVLVRRGDHEVVRTVVNNQTARFSETGFAALVRRAGHDDVLAVQVGRRGDIPAPLFRKLVMQATGVVQARLLATAPPDRQAAIRRALAKASDEVAARGAQQRDYAAAQESVAALQRAGRLREEELVEIAKAGKLVETVAALAALCTVPLDIVDRLIGGGRPDPILILCKAMNFRWSTVAVVLSLRFGVRRPAMDTAQAQFERLSTPTAQRVVRFWQTRPARAIQTV
jgi:uncharacterized protein (DUF2336 family)